MGSPGAITFSMFLFLFQAASAVDPKQDFARRLGSFVDFPLRIPKGANYTDIIMRSTTRGEALFIWIGPGKPLKVLDPKYSGRITLQKNTDSFRIHNLTMADGGEYKLSMRTVRADDKVIQTFTLFIFDIKVTTKTFSNNTCSLNLRCEAGAGGETLVMYTWKQKDTGITRSQDAWLPLVMVPGSEEEIYTCTAQAHGIQSALDIAPYQCCDIVSGVAGQSASGLLSYYPIANTVLVCTAIALLVLL